jgi:hypothetical protein
VEGNCLAATSGDSSVADVIDEMREGSMIWIGWVAFYFVSYTAVLIVAIEIYARLLHRIADRPRSWLTALSVVLVYLGLIVVWVSSLPLVLGRIRNVDASLSFDDESSIMAILGTLSMILGMLFFKRRHHDALKKRRFF